MQGIGTLQEKNLHAQLKEYYQIDPTYREVKVGRFVADSYDGHRILEIQTAHFNHLRDKLLYFVQVAPVTVIYPVPRMKYIVAMDPETGDVHHRRKSPKMGTPFELLPELYRLRPILPLPRVTFKVVLLDLEETRRYVPKDEKRYRQKTRLNRYPTELVEEKEFSSVNDFRFFIPDTLSQSFTVNDYQKATPLSLFRARQALQVLVTLGVVHKVGKQGRKDLFSLSY